MVYWSPTFHPLHSTTTTTIFSSFPSLSSLCCDKLVSDSSLLASSSQLPQVLLTSLLSASLLSGRDRCVHLLLSSYRSTTLIHSCYAKTIE